MLSRQAQEVELLQGRIDGDKVRALIASLLPVRSMDEVFICGPEAMIVATETALIDAGVPADRVHAERFTSGPVVAAKVQPSTEKHVKEKPANKNISLTVVLEGKQQDNSVRAHEALIDGAREGRSLIHH